MCSPARTLRWLSPLSPWLPALAFCRRFRATGPQYPRGLVGAGIVPGARGGKDSLPQFGRELIGPAEGVETGGGRHADELGDVLEGTAGFQGRLHVMTSARELAPAG